MSYPLWVHRVDAKTTLTVRFISHLLAKLTFSSIDKIPARLFGLMIFFALLQFDSNWWGEGALLWLGIITVVLFPVVLGIFLGATLIFIQLISGGMDQHYQEYRLGRGHAAWSYMIAIPVTIWFCHILLPGYAGCSTFLANAIPAFLAWEVFLTRDPDDDYDLPKGPPRRRRRRRIKKAKRAFGNIPGFLQPQY